MKVKNFDIMSAWLRGSHI